jgi:GINS complex subunit 3
VALNATYAFIVPSLRHGAEDATGQIKRDCKVQIPLWMAYILIYSCVRVGHGSQQSNSRSDRDYADFTIPGPFNTRVQNALKAEPTSVKLAGLVGAGGLWYGFGRMLLTLYVNYFQLHSTANRRSEIRQIRRRTRRLDVRAPRKGRGHSHDP